MAILQVFQAKLYCFLDESGINAPALKELCSATDLALRTMKATAQAIRRSMVSLVVLEHYIWLHLTETKEADKVAFLDAPVSPAGLFGPAVEGFTDRFTAAPKSSQAMRHFPKSAPTQQQSKPATSATQTAPPKEQR